jgi:hypothetical protein
MSHHHHRHRTAGDRRLTDVIDATSARDTTDATNTPNVMDTIRAGRART